MHDELRRSLESAHKSLRRYLKEAEAVSGSDVDAVDPAVLRAARAQLHQGVGALEMIGLPGPARVLRASENAVQRFIARPKLLTRAAVEAIESASFGVLDYLSRKLAGKGLPTLALFPQYRALQEWAGADRVHPADLWRDDWAVAGAGSRRPCSRDPRRTTRRARPMETQVLAIMRSRRPRGDAAAERPVRRPRRRVARPPGRVCGSCRPRSTKRRRPGCCSPTSMPSASARACWRSCA